jgi:hypothetical protein
LKISEEIGNSRFKIQKGPARDSEFEIQNSRTSEAQIQNSRFRIQTGRIQTQNSRERGADMPINHHEIIEDFEAHIRRFGGELGEWCVGTAKDSGGPFFRRHRKEVVSHQFSVVSKRLN